MAANITVPQFPESVTEGTLLTWRKQPGEAVARGEVLAEIETDKVVFEVPAPQDGVLIEIAAPIGATVKSGQMIGRLDKATAASPALLKPVAAAIPVKPAVVVMPAAKRMMEERAVDARVITGTGKGGRVLKEDVAKQLDKLDPIPVTPTVKPVSVKPAPAPMPPTVAGARPERRVPMTRLRTRIAERLLEAQNNAAILTTFNEVNMQPVMELRTRHRERFEKEHGVRLGFMAFS